MPGFNVDSTGATSQNVVYADNVDFSGSPDPAPQITTNGQLLIGSTATPNIRPGSITSPNSSITIGYSSPNITIETANGPAVVEMGVDASTSPGTNPVPPNGSGVITVTGGQVPAGTTANVIQTNSLAANTYTIEIQRSQTAASSTVGDNGVCHFNSSQFTVDGNGFVSAVGALPSNLAYNYTNVSNGMSPYTVNVTTPPFDYYISVDCSSGPVVLKFPNSPTFKQEWIIKDRTGSASTNNISITTVGGSVTIDGQTTYLITSNHGSVNLLANATPTYEVW